MPPGTNIWRVSLLWLENQRSLWLVVVNLIVGARRPARVSVRTSGLPPSVDICIESTSVSIASHDPVMLEPVLPRNIVNCIVQIPSLLRQFPTALSVGKQSVLRAWNRIAACHSSFSVLLIDVFASSDFRRLSINLIWVLIILSISICYHLVMRNWSPVWPRFRLTHCLIFSSIKTLLSHVCCSYSEFLLSTYLIVGDSLV